ncbi:MAG: aldo/keto reductase, partial [Lentisphaerae bacterium]
MIYHTHPRTGHKLSAIGFGGMRFRDQNDREACAQLLL